MRPSTSVRNHRLRLLLAEFSSRKLRVVDISGLLDCSPSSARNYVFELADACVILPSPECGDGRIRKDQYCLSSNADVVDAFKAGLDRLQNGAGARAGTVRRGQKLGDSASVRIVTLASSTLQASTPVFTGRDPLVTALFGNAQAEKRLD